MDLALEKSRIKFPKKFQEISRKTLKMDEDILKDIHILKLNILGCDIYTLLGEHDGSLVINNFHVSFKSCVRINTLGPYIYISIICHQSPNSTPVLCWDIEGSVVSRKISNQSEIMLC